MRNHREVEILDLAANAETSVQDFSHCWLGVVVIQWTGDAAGTFQVQIAASKDGPWFDEQAGQAAGGAPGTKSYKITDLGHFFLKLKYTSTSGTGSATVTFNSKGV